MTVLYMDLGLDGLICLKAKTIHIQILRFELSSAPVIRHCLLETVLLGKKLQSE